MLALLAVLALPAGAHASSSQSTIFEAPRELLSGDATQRQQTLDEIDGLGAHWVRVVLYWHSVAPAAGSRTRPSFAEKDPAAYDWSTYDAAIQSIRARGMKVLLTVSGPVPRWATSGAKDTLTRPSATRFGRFMHAVGTHYRTEVDMWSIWNEPNHPGFLMPQYRLSHGKRIPVSPGIYRKLFQYGAKGLDASGNVGDRVLMGETAPVGTTRVVAPLTFIRGAMCLDSRYHKRRGCHKLPADGYAHHAYGHAAPWTGTRSSNDVTIGTLSRLNHALAAAGATGAIRKNMGIYLTEFGVQSKPDPAIGVSQTAQAEFRSIAEHMAYANPRVRSFSQYLMRDDPARSSGPRWDRYAGFESGLRFASGRRKLSYEGFRTPLVARRRSSRTVALWGLVRPHHSRESLTIDYRAAGSSHWHRLKSDRTNSGGYWWTTTRYRTGRSYRVRWNGNTGPNTRVYSHG
jgi:hypothetical protein